MATVEPTKERYGGFPPLKVWRPKGAGVDMYYGYIVIDDVQYRLTPAEPMSNIFFCVTDTTGSLTRDPTKKFYIGPDAYFSHHDPWPADTERKDGTWEDRSKERMAWYERRATFVAKHTAFTDRRSMILADPGKYVAAFTKCPRALPAAPAPAH